MILHSKITKITPERSQITPDHTRSFQNDKLFFTGPRQTICVHRPPPLPKPRETPHTSNGPTVAIFRFKSEKNHIIGHNLEDQKDYRNEGVS